MLSNFLLLFTIVIVIFLMSIILFFLYNDGYSFELVKFIKPYIIITIPTMFFIASLAIVFEVLFVKYTILQNVGFFFLFCFLLVLSPKKSDQFALDVFGSKVVIHQLEEMVKEITKTDKTTSMNIGYVLANTKKPEKFEFTGIQFSSIFIISRVLWVLLSVLLVANGYQIDTACNGLDASEKCQTSHYDILIIDHLMPIMNGIKFVENYFAISPERKLKHPAVLSLTQQARQRLFS